VPPAGVYDQTCPPLTGGSGGAPRSARSASLRASRPASTTACSSPTSAIHASTSSSRGSLSARSISIAWGARTRSSLQIA
jgi:hypothetical protein